MNARIITFPQGICKGERKPMFMVHNTLTGDTYLTRSKHHAEKIQRRWTYSPNRNSLERGLPQAEAREGDLAMALDAHSDPTNKEHGLAFDSDIRKLRPDWLQMGSEVAP